MTRRRRFNAPPPPTDAEVARAYAMRCRGLSIDLTAHESGLTIDQVRKYVPKLPWQTDPGKRLMAMRRLRQVSGEEKKRPPERNRDRVRKREQVASEVEDWLREKADA